ncbi:MULTISPECIES: ferredoxin [Gordonia]|jgi:ferredoxin|uniref:Ferredoxin-2 n=1 Tax=Gordonia insulae TaxID=2420509 RepID=A0A3G8JKY4_9ACTN|nr:MULTISPECIES: ferredoxin [Gordonia]ASR03193.1 Ferredoxin-2 [Gordonia rubripertincta]AZG45538.1 Ferredoxin-2 [Gordonia insulae]
MRIHIALDECEGHGMCAMHEPDLYDIDDDGFAAKADFVVPQGMEPAARNGATRCPMSAIKIIED